MFKWLKNGSQQKEYYYTSAAIKIKSPRCPDSTTSERVKISLNIFLVSEVFSLQSHYQPLLKGEYWIGWTSAGMKVALFL